MTQKVLLYYKYTPIANPAKLVKDQKKLCEDLGLKGRILISSEGINGTVGGDPQNVDKYVVETSKVEGFEDMEWKVSYVEGEAFPRLRVVEREEIVTLGLKAKGKDADITNRADYIEPEELRDLYDKNEEFYIIDARNNYEAEIGKFKNAITFDVESFRDIPPRIQSGELDNLKQKNVILYCTGGVRCEKFSAFMREEGFENVRHLHGGVHVYSEKAGGKHFDGELYVFDGRVHVPVNFVNPEVISECLYCHEKVARYRNCKNKRCNKKMIICEPCEEKTECTCSTECQSVWRENMGQKMTMDVNASA